MKVKLQDVIDQIEMQTTDSAAYLNKKTGALFMLGEEEMAALDREEEDLEDNPEWIRQSVQKAAEIRESDDWIELPTQFDVHEYHIMEEFGGSLDDPKARNQILQSIRGSGAFRRFKQTLDFLGLREQWFAFLDAEIERIAIEWLEDNQIEFSREPDITGAESTAIN